MSRVFAVLFVYYFIQTVHTNNGWIGWNAEEAEDDHDDLFNIAGKQFNQQKSQLFSSVGLEEGNMEEFLTKTAKTMESQLFSFIGLEEGKEEEFLTKILEKMNIASRSISQLTASFTDQESIKRLISNFSNPDKLAELLSQQTSMDKQSINGFVQQVEEYTQR